MAYTSASDVEARLDLWGVAPFTVSSNPTLAEVNGFIAQYEAQINGILRAQGYTTVPATGEDDVNMLKRFVASRAAAQVFSITFTAQTFPDAVKQWIADWDLFIRMLRDGELRLVNQDPASTEAGGIVMGSFTLLSYDYSDFESGSIEW